MILFTIDALAYPPLDGASHASRQPNPDTKKLWHALYAQYHGKMILMVPEDVEYAAMVTWAKAEGFKYSQIDVFDRPGPEGMRDRVRDLNAVYGKIDWFIDTNPKTIKLVMQDAIPCLMPTLPAFIRPEWRDDGPRQRQVWDDLVREVEVQSLYRATKESE